MRGAAGGRAIQSILTTVTIDHAENYAIGRSRRVDSENYDILEDNAPFLCMHIAHSPLVYTVVGYFYILFQICPIQYPNGF